MNKPKVKKGSRHPFKKNYVLLFLWILVFQGIGFFIGEMTRSNISGWYHTLIKSPFNPPDYVFPIVWSILYILLAIIGWYLYGQRNTRNGRMIFNGYALQMIMNWVWTPLFFEWHFIAFSFFWIIAIIFLVIWVIFQSYKKFKLVAVWLTPYLMWLLFASYLTYFIWMHN